MKTYSVVRTSTFFEESLRDSRKAIVAIILYSSRLHVRFPFNSGMKEGQRTIRSVHEVRCKNDTMHSRGEVTIAPERDGGYSCCRVTC